MSWATSTGNLQAADYIIDKWARMVRTGLEKAREAAGESPDGNPPAAAPAPAAATPPKPTPPTSK